MKTKIAHLFAITCVLLGIGMATNCTRNYDFDVDNSIYDHLTIEVANAVNGVISTDIAVEESITLKFSDTSVYLDNRSFAFVLSDTIATIDATGIIKPLKAGIADLTVILRGTESVRTTCKLEITEQIFLVEQINHLDTLDKVKVPLGKTFDFKLEAGIYFVPANASNKTLKYTSLDKAVATIDENTGILTPVSPGIAKILLSSTDGSGVTKECSIIIVDQIKVSSIVVASDLEGRSIELGSYLFLDAPFVTTLPANASIPDLEYEVISGGVTVNEIGVLQATALGAAKVKISTTDGSNVSTELNITVVEKTTNKIDRYIWSITGTYVSRDGSKGDGPLQKILDGKTDTYAVIVKPGKSYNDVTTPMGSTLSFTVDLKANPKYNTIFWGHRTGNTVAYLRVWGISVYGSNDDVTYTEIKTNIDVPNSDNTTPKKLSIPESEYRYLKVIMDKFDPSNGSTVQIGEFDLSLE